MAVLRPSRWAAPAAAADGGARVAVGADREKPDLTLRAVFGMVEADPLLAVEPAVGDWPSASGAAEWLSASGSVKASSSKLGRRRRYARLVVEIVGSRRFL